jgi:uncharacterized protein (DUF1800 family)
MPAFNETTIRHLLRRTEFVDRNARVIELLQLGSLNQAVANVLDVGTPATTSLTGPGRWERSAEYIHFWLNSMAHDSARPFQEKMAMFWHGHFCSEFVKVVSADRMQEQLDLFRTIGLGPAGSTHSIVDLTKQVSVQVAMLRYLDNNLNRASSPNQNFGRELMELFVLGVGNYTEADVEANTAAWTGHSTDFETEYGAYVWRGDWHDSSAKSFLGQRINTGTHLQYHGIETIDVMFGSGQVPLGAERNGGRPTREVSAEFFSRKLWVHLAGVSPSQSVVSSLAGVLLSTGFQIRPWVEAMLTSDEFYSSQVVSGLVRTPVDYVVALMHATGKRSEEGASFKTMQTMGQLPMYPPNVAGWGGNASWVSAATMSGRIDQATRFASSCAATFEQPGGGLIIRGQKIPTSDFVGRRADGSPSVAGRDLTARMLQLLEIRLTPTELNEVMSLAERAVSNERLDVLLLILLCPSLNVG